MKYATKEQRENQIRLYAFHWYEIRMKYGILGDEKSDWEKAEMMIDAEFRIENPRREK